MYHIMEEKQLMDFELISRTEGTLFHNHLVIYFVLNGELKVTVGEKKILSSEKDFIFVNPFQSHSLLISENGLVMGFFVNMEYLSAYYDVSRLEFVGDSSKGEPERYSSFRKLMENCIVYYYGKRTRDGRILLKLNSLYFQMAEQMIASFSVVKRENHSVSGKASDEVLLQNMMRYVRLNYQSQLKLEELAERFYLSTSYVSRYFKKKLGINFGKYLTEIRLDAAVRELNNTNKPMTRIAMDCGFPNLASFNKAFRDAYEMTPKVFRESRKEENGETEESAEDSSMAYRLLDYLERNHTILEEENEQIETVETDSEQYTYLNRTWNRIINIGRIAMLLRTSVQEQVLFLQEELDFQYVRIWDLYDPELRLKAESEEHRYNFSRLDSALDFLVEHKLKPYIQLGFKPDILVDAYLSYYRFEERDLIFPTANEYGVFIHWLMRHLLNRYGIQEISDWIFEQWCDPRFFENGNPALYFSYFEEAYQEIKTVVPQAKVGGDYDRTYDIIDYGTLISQWSTRRVQPDFVSIYCYPPIMSEAFDYMRTTSSREKNRIEDYLKQQKQILLNYGMHMPVYVSEWNFTVINCNVLNDSCFKGAYVMDTIMRLFLQTEAMGYWFGSDIFAEDDAPPLLLNGRCGLITHQSICKPAFWAIKFLNRLKNCLLVQSEHSMVTRDEFGSYEIVCHNCRQLDVQYYVRQEKDITIDAIPTLFCDKKSLILKFTVNGAKNGLYKVKMRRVNSHYGGVQDEWSRMGQATFLNQRDVDYVRNMSGPRITISEQRVTDHTIRLTTTLEPQEIQSIHFFRYIEEAN